VVARGGHGAATTAERAPAQVAVSENAAISTARA
jgi:hypothetical protein